MNSTFLPLIERLERLQDGLELAGQHDAFAQEAADMVVQLQNLAQEFDGIDDYSVTVKHPDVVDTVAPVTLKLGTNAAAIMLETQETPANQRSGVGRSLLILLARDVSEVFSAIYGRRLEFEPQHLWLVPARVDQFQ